MLSMRWRSKSLKGVTRKSPEKLERLPLEERWARLVILDNFSVAFLSLFASMELTFTIFCLLTCTQVDPRIGFWPAQKLPRWPNRRWCNIKQYWPLFRKATPGV